MMYSIYHFFASLIQTREAFWTVEKLDQFPFETTMLSCVNKGRFPDLAIRLNTDRALFTGGELVELKDSRSYTIASFNSTIPSGRKHVDKFITSHNSKIYQQMVEAGDDVYALPMREVYYLVRGTNGKYTKIVLIHGSFFETVKADQLIQRAFMQIIEEQSSRVIPEDILRFLETMPFEQHDFSQTRDIEQASVKIRFRIMTEAKAQANIFDERYYPEISDDTLNFVIPCDDDATQATILQQAQHAFDIAGLQQFKIKHVLNGEYLVFQVRK